MADSICPPLGNRCESPALIAGVSGHAGVLLAANNWLNGDDGFKHTDPDPPQQSDRHRAWHAYHPAIHAAVEYIPRGTTAQATRRSRRFSAVLQLRMAPQTELRALRASISKPRLKPRGASARPSHRRFLTVLPAPRVPPLPSPAPDPQTVGETRTHASSPANGDSPVPSVACELLFGEHDDGPNKDKLTSWQMAIVPVALRHAISDRQIRGDPLIN